MTLVAASALALGLLLALTACAAESPQPHSTLRSDVLPGLASRTRSLDAEAIAADALDPEPLLRLLEKAGYVIGSEREFSGQTSAFNHVVARVLLFEDSEGAGAYLDWLASHGSDILGQAQRHRPLALPGSPLFFSHIRTGCCPKETPTFLTAWQRGATVFWLLASGPGANRQTVTSLAGDLASVV